MVLAHILGPRMIKDNEENEVLALLQRWKGPHFTGIGPGGAYREGSLYPGTNQPSCVL